MCNIPSPACHSGNCVQAKNNLLYETWLRKVNLNPRIWTNDADSWFITGEPNRAEWQNLNAPAAFATTLMKINSPDFEHIKICGNFQVQIVGGQDQNSVYVLGPNAAARVVAVQNYGRVLYIRQARDCDPRICAQLMDKVIVRIGVHKLRSITNTGNGDIYGRNIKSSNMVLSSAGCGNTMLKGDINLKQVNQYGGGTVTILGANTPRLDINVRGNGSVNVSGHVGVRSIQHYGNGIVSIIGADTDNLCISAAGCGLTTVAGYANLKSVTAVNSSHVYVYWVSSDSTDVCEHDNAFIGLAGATRNLNVDVDNSAHFDGQYLRANNAYVRTRGESHANVLAAQKIFSDAQDNSSTYIFGSPRNVSRFANKDAQIIPVGPNYSTLSMSPPPQPWNAPSNYSYKGETH